MQEGLYAPSERRSAFGLYSLLNFEAQAGWKGCPSARRLQQRQAVFAYFSIGITS